MKKMVKRLDEIRTRFGIVETNEQDFKQVTGRCRAAPAHRRLAAQ